MLSGNVTIPALDPREASKVVRGLERLVKYITASERWNIQAVIITGSIPSGWGRLPESDLDVLVITRMYDLSFRHRVRASLKGLDLPCRFAVFQSPSLIFNRMPLIARYDLREMGRVIYGDRKVLESAYNVTLPRYEALRYLFNVGIVGLISRMETEMFDETYPSAHPTSDLCRASVKAYLAICCALLILKRQYLAGYAARKRRFQQIYETHYPSLCAEIPDLAEKIRLSTNAKLGSTPSLATAPGLVERVTSDVCGVLRYCLRTYFGSTAEDESRLLLMLDRFPHNWLSSLHYFARYMALTGKCPPVRCLFVEPIVNVYIASACVLLGARDHDPSKYLGTAKSRILEMSSPLSFSTEPWHDWDIVRRTCVFLHGEMLGWGGGLLGLGGLSQSP